jgi:outer membrane protein OmpA-like peptidoglycan-associated protein
MNLSHVTRIFALLVLAALATAFALPAHADGAAGCKNPAWAPTPMSGFAIDSCDHKDWSSVDVDLPTQTKTLQGHFTSVDYALPAENGPSAEAVKQHQIKAAEAAGAKLESDPGDPYKAVLMRKTAQGEFWYIYDHGSGNDESTTSYTLTTIEIAPPAQYVVARLITTPVDTQSRTCANPPWLVKQFPWFKLEDCTQRDIGSIKLDLPQGEKTLAGRMLDTNYTLTDASKDMTARAVRDNYIRALQKIGAKLVSDPDNEFQAVLTQKTAQGDLWYIYNHGSGSSDSTEGYALTTLQVGGPAPKACTLEVYGVHFDTDKAILRPESTPVLEQVLAMLQQDPASQFEIGGHTDDAGTAAHNLSLSDARAKAVVDWLVAHGITASRLSSHGYGESRPLVPNDSDKHRAQNRRVEMKNRNCAQ